MDDTILNEAIEKIGTEASLETSFESEFTEFLESIIKSYNAFISLIYGDKVSNGIAYYFYKNHFFTFFDDYDHSKPEVSMVFEAKKNLLGLIKGLSRYAEQGIYTPIYGSAYNPQQKDSQSDEDNLPEDIKYLSKLLRTIPFNWLKSRSVVNTYYRIWLIAGKAQARYMLDKGKTLTFNEIVLLSGMNPKSVRNATQKRHGNKRLIVDNNDTIKNTDAVNWLIERKSFIPTPNSNYQPQVNYQLDTDDIVFIPVSEEGEVFCPLDARNLSIYQVPGGSYTIFNGNFESSEEEFIDYFEALEKLKIFEDGGWVKYSDWIENGEWKEGGGKCDEYFIDHWIRYSKSQLLTEEKTAIQKIRAQEKQIK